MALIVNEFVTNSAKHAFPDERQGTIRIEGRGSDGGFTLLCSDDGAGGEDAMQRIKEGGGLGGRIVAALAASIGATTRWAVANPGLQLELLVPAQPTSTMVPPSVRE